jgi:hypothetical protein
MISDCVSFLYIFYLKKHTDRFTQHRYKCDQAFELDTTKSPVAQYLDIAKIVDICVKNKVEGKFFWLVTLHHALVVVVKTRSVRIYSKN